jgi:hypothetical protein
VKTERREGDPAVALSLQPGDWTNFPGRGINVPEAVRIHGW